MRPAALAALLLLASCENSPDKLRSDIDVADANGRNALGRIEELADRVDTLEREKRDLESKISTLESDTQTLDRQQREYLDAAVNDIKSLRAKQNEIIDYLQARQRN